MKRAPKVPHARMTLRVLARLLSYPDAALRAHLPELGEVLRAERALSTQRLDELDALLASLSRGDPLECEAAYVQLFDRGRSTSLHLFEHVHGDSRDRGPAMIDLAQTYEKAGLVLAPGELPDYLPAVLEFVSTQPPAEAREFLSEMTHIFTAIWSTLDQRCTAYAAAFGALIELAGERAIAVRVTPDEPLDATWAEPVVFDGCSAQGQAKPGDPQPIRIVRKDNANQAWGVS